MSPFAVGIDALVLVIHLVHDDRGEPFPAHSDILAARDIDERIATPLKRISLGAENNAILKNDLDVGVRQESGPEIQSVGCLSTTTISTSESNAR